MAERFALTWPNPSSICASFNELYTLHWFLVLHGAPKGPEISPPLLFCFHRRCTTGNNTRCRNDLKTRLRLRDDRFVSAHHNEFATRQSQRPLRQTTIKQTHADKPSPTTDTPSPRTQNACHLKPMPPKALVRNQALRRLCRMNCATHIRLRLQLLSSNKPFCLVALI